MARTLSSCPQAASAFLQAPAAGLSDLYGLWRWLLAHSQSTRPLELAAVTYIAALAFAELTSNEALPLPIVLAGIALIALALWKPATGDPAASAAAQAALAGGPLPAPCDDENMAPETRRHFALAAMTDRDPAAADPMSKNAAWIELMARVSHDLRTPLNAVIGFSDVMDAELLGPVGHPRYREYARHIRDSGRELLKSAEDTLAITALLANPASLDRTTCLDFEALATEAWASLSAAAASRAVTLDIVAPEGLGLLGDRRPLRQILTNLFTEAIDRAAPGGAVVLKATTDGGVVQLEFVANGPAAGPRPAEASLAVCLARALLDLHGATLIEMKDRSCAWRAVTVLECAAQQDFFALPDARDRQPARVC
jgi:signal transduction histidine kinase